MRIARPLLSVTTPVGVVWGLYEAWRVGPWLAGLMALLLAVISGFVYMTWRVIRAEAREQAGKERDGSG
jgi:zinc transporter ZupT